MPRRLMRAVRNLPLQAKLLLPYLALLAAMCTVATYVVVHDAATRVQSQTDTDLTTLTADARTAVHDSDLYAEEGAVFAANLEGAETDVARHRGDLAARLLRSVVAFKPDLELVTLTDASGRVVAAVDSDGRTTTAPGAVADLARVVVPAARASASLGQVGGVPSVFVGVPVCGGQSTCDPDGAAVVALPATNLLAQLQSGQGMSVVDAAGTSVASGGIALSGAPWPSVAGSQVVRQRTGSSDVATSALVVEGRPVGQLRVGVSTAARDAAVRREALTIALVLLGTLIGVVLVGVVLARTVLSRVRVLLRTVGAIGAGDLTARTGLDSGDELGDLAVGVDRMAGELQANVDTLEVRVAQRTQEVARLLQQRSSFFAHLSHELRTPLAVIRARATMLADEQRVSRVPGASESLQSVHESADQLLGIVDALLESARGEAAAVPLEVRPTRIADVLGPVRRTAAGLASAAGIQVSVPEAAAGLPDVLADPDRLREVLIGLVDNAVKYTPRGGTVAVTATLVDDPENSRVALAVVDDGPGIPADAAEHLYDAFFTVPGRAPLHGRSSTGLGLALIRQVVVGMNGSIAHTQTPGGGTTATVSLPVAARAEPAAGPSPSSGSRRGRRRAVSTTAEPAGRPSAFSGSAVG